MIIFLDSIVQIIEDGVRHVLYTRSEKGSIRVRERERGLCITTHMYTRVSTTKYPYDMNVKNTMCTACWTFFVPLLGI